MTISVSETITLELLNEQHAEAFLALRNRNYAYLSAWLPWVKGMQTVDDFEKYIRRCLQRYQDGLEAPFAIVVNGEVAGRIGINYIDANRIAAIGYWLGENFGSKGVMTQACQKMIDYGFTNLNLNRIEIKCGVENYRSQAVPERLGFTKEGTMRQAEWVNGKFIDLYLYSILKEEWGR